MNGVRLDKWLWAARLFKTRPLAAVAIDGGKVEVNGARAKRARILHVGDRLWVRVTPYEYRLTVRALAERRGSPAQALTLYEEAAESKREREALAAQLKQLPSVMYRGKGRPTKKDRRTIERWNEER